MAACYAKVLPVFQSYISRYIGAIVTDLHRNPVNGGI